VEEREEEREEKQAVSLQPAWTQEPKNFVRDKWACINIEDVITV